MIKSIRKPEIIAVIQVGTWGAAHSICNLNEIHIVFHNDLNYGYHFIISQLANEFMG